MALNFTYSNFIYLDTNILSYFAKNINVWSSLQKFLVENDLCIAISDAHFAELYDAKKLHSQLSNLLILIPSAIIKTREKITEEEVKSHPNIRTETLLLYPLNQLMLERNGINKLMNYLNSNKLAKARKEQLIHAKMMRKVHKNLKRNFPPSRSGKYFKKQASEFADMITIQWLRFNNKQFLKNFINDIEKLNFEIFLSVRTFAYTIFYKYYLQNREPNKLSDFGDLFHVFYIPYCKLAIMERDLCNVLNQIKGNSDILNYVEIENIDFLNNIKNILMKDITFIK